VPTKESSPTLLLLRPKNFEVLFGLMHTLGSMKTIDEEEVIHLYFLLKMIKKRFLNK